MRRFLFWSIVAASLLGYFVVRWAMDVPAGVVGTIGFATFAAIELVTAAWLTLAPTRDTKLVAAHVLNAIGALLLSYSGLRGEALVPTLIGAPFFIVGMLLWARELQARQALTKG